MHCPSLRSAALPLAPPQSAAPLFPSRRCLPRRRAPPPPPPPAAAAASLLRPRAPASPSPHPSFPIAPLPPPTPHYYSSSKCRPCRSQSLSRGRGSWICEFAAHAPRLTHPSERTSTSRKGSSSPCPTARPAPQCSRHGLTSLFPTAGPCILACRAPSSLPEPSPLHGSAPASG
ncbi:hypothetical protein PVAP13_9KG177926 [Panicum virgatum]|uniref:Uncharacterized protein n=1 Tax=Panicum virgatum TaxID=38727 RepID=A0A8T0NLQ4_PANVG|nr:hypothetical protein PVAP13_9KG177926 [Panicum virgatum]